MTDIDPQEGDRATPSRRAGLLVFGLVALLLGVVVALILTPGWVNDAPVSASANGPGGPFTLTNTQGRTVTNRALLGKPYAIFFGFTRCPDVCPTTLSDVAQVMDDLGADAEKVQPLFVSIDPERDRRLGLAAYTAAFHPAILGLAGTETETQAAADSFKIFYERENDAASLDGYSMAHSPGLFLIGPDGEWLRQFTYGTSAAEILSDLQTRF